MTKTKKKWIVPVIATVLAVALVASIILALSLREKKTPLGRFDYTGSDMSRYVHLEESDYKGLVAEISKDYEITDEVVEAYIKRSLLAIKTLQEDGEGKTDVAVEFGDIAYVRYEGSVDGTAFDGGSNTAQSSPYALSIGSGSFIDDFEDQLIGVIPEQTSNESPVYVTVTFPENYAEASLAGKEAVFRVWIEYVDKYDVPALTPKVIREQLNYESKTSDGELIAEYRAYVRKNLEVANEATVRNAAIESILDKVVERADFKKIPKSEISYWEDLYMTQIRSDRANYAQNGQVYDSLDEFACMWMGLEAGSDWHARLEDIYMSNIKKRMVCHAVAQLEGIVLSDAEFESEVNYLIAYYAEMKVNYTRNDIIEVLGTEAIEEEALYTKVCGYLYTMSKIIYEQ